MAVMAPSGNDFNIEANLVAGLRARDDRAFEFLIDRYHAPLNRLALSYVPSRAVAEEVVQETWIGVLRGIDKFEGRSSLSTWIYRILLNIARTRGVKENRSVPFASVGSPDDESSVDVDRFAGIGIGAPHHWATIPSSWEHIPEARLLGAETLEEIKRALDALPEAQREVVAMRDVLGMTSEEICNALDISETNQRVLLHRGRSKLRAALEQFLEGDRS